jgi:hypothetical protein
MNLRQATTGWFKDSQVATVVGKVTHATVIEKRIGRVGRGGRQSGTMAVGRCRGDLRVLFVLSKMIPEGLLLAKSLPFI